MDSHAPRSRHSALSFRLRHGAYGLHIGQPRSYVAAPPHFEARVGHEPVQEVAPVAPSGYGPVSEEGRVAAAAVGDRVVAAVGRGVDGDDVGAVGEVGTAGDRQAVVVVVQDGEPAGFRGDVEAMRGGV